MADNVSLEGPWDRVHQVIGQAHTLLHQQGIVRIQTDIRTGSRYLFSLLCTARFRECPLWMYADMLHLDRTDKLQTAEDKVNKVRQLLKE